MIIFEYHSTSTQGGQFRALVYPSARASSSEQKSLHHIRRAVMSAAAPSESTLWERAVAEDFAEFRKAGLTHPMMVDIEKELGVSP